MTVLTGTAKRPLGVGFFATLIGGFILGWNLSPLLHLKQLPHGHHRFARSKYPQAPPAPTAEGRTSLLNLNYSPKLAYSQEQHDFKPGYSGHLGCNQSLVLRPGHAQTEEGKADRCRRLLARKGMAGWNVDQNEFEELRCHKRLSLLRTAAARARIKREGDRENVRKMQVYNTPFTAPFVLDTTSFLSPWQAICAGRPLRGSTCFNPDSGLSYRCVDAPEPHREELFSPEHGSVCLNGTRGRGACELGQLLCRLNVSSIITGAEGLVSLGCDLRASTLADLIVRRAPHVGKGDTAQDFYEMHRCGREEAIENGIEQLLQSAHWDKIRASDIEDFIGRNVDADEKLTDLNFKKHTYRLQIIGRSVIWSPAFAQHCETAVAGGRAEAIGDSIADILAQVSDIPELDMLVYVGDRFTGSMMPWLDSSAASHPANSSASTTAQSYVPVPLFVQEMTRDASAIMAPPRSVPYRIGVNDGLGPSNLFRQARAGAQRDWSSRKNKAVWRGSTTGGLYTPGNWRKFQRSKVVAVSTEFPDILDARFTDLSQVREEDRQEMTRIFQAENMLGERMAYHQQMEHRMVVVVDGNSVADRFAEQLAMGAAVLKVDSPHKEFWYPDAVPNVHYIPVARDVSDLAARLREARLPGNSEWVRKIAERGSVFIRSRLSKEALGCYWVQLLKAYGSHFAGPVDPARECRLHFRRRSDKRLSDQYEGG